MKPMRVAAGVGIGLGLALLAGAGVAAADAADQPAPGPHRRAPAVANAKRQAVQVNSAHAVTTKGITVNPTVTLVDGIVQGSMRATSSRDLPLTVSAIGGSAGGKIDTGTVGGDPQSYTALPYATWFDTGAKGAETFSVRVREVTPLDQFLIGIPVIGLAADPVINLLQQLPLIGDLLIPLIGASVVARFDVDTATLAPGDTPVAFTYKVTSFDGTPISTNFFPAAGLQAGGTAATVMYGPGLGDQGAIDPYQSSGTADSVPGVGLQRQAGFDVITWDPRGEYDSGGIMQIDNPFYEGRDTSAIISWAAVHTPAALNAPGDPKIGMVGGSYGGGIQLVTASIDPRIDAIAPDIAWNSVNTSLYPHDIFKTAWADILLAFLIGAAARVNDQIYEGIFTGNVFGFLSQTSQSTLASAGPTALLEKLKVPTLLVQGTVDELFPPDEAVANAESIMGNPWSPTVKMLWFCGGHGICLDPENPGQQGRIYADTLSWMQQYVAGTGQMADAIPAFQWYDQNGDYHSSALLPFQEGFASPYTVTGSGGSLGIVPLLGGSGLLATPAVNAINITATPAVGSQIVGSPQLTFSYQGLGTSRAVYAQLVDNSTGRVVGSLVSPVPVTLDGQPHTVSVPMYGVAYTVGDGDSLTLQITSSAAMFANSSIGVITISAPQLDLPVRQL